MTITAATKAAIKAIEDASGNWTGYEWECPQIDALAKLYKIVDDIPAIGEDDLEAARYTQADGSYSEQCRETDNRNALQKMRSAIETLRDAAQTLEFLHDDLVGAIEKSAERAQQLADDARQALTEGRFADAIEAMAEATYLERQYGDDPVWGPVEALVEAAAFA